MIQICQGQVRVSGMGTVMGLDIPAVLAVAEAIGVDRTSMAQFLDVAEQGILLGLKAAMPSQSVLGDG